MTKEIAESFENGKAYVWVEVNEELKSYEIDLSKAVTSEEIAFVNSTTKRIEVETDGSEKTSEEVDGELTNQTKDQAEKIYIDITATKIWDDDSNKAGKRPGSVEIVLVKDGTPTVIKDTAKSDNGWKVTFANLEKYKADGTEINYTIQEAQTQHYKAPTYGTNQEGLTVTNE